MLVRCSESKGKTKTPSWCTAVPQAEPGEGRYYQGGAQPVGIHQNALPGTILKDPGQTGDEVKKGTPC